MIAGLGCGLGILLVLATGGSFSAIAVTRVRFAAIAVVVFLVQGAARGRLPFLNEGSLSLVIWGVAGLGVVALVWANRELWGAWLLGVGTCLNLITVLLNNGMPVVSGAHSPGLVAGDGFYHHVRPSDVAVVFADLLPVPGGWQMSIGDLLLIVGVIVVLLAHSVDVPQPQ